MKSGWSLRGGDIRVKEAGTETLLFTSVLFVCSSKILCRHWNIFSKNIQKKNNKHHSQILLHLLNILNINISIILILLKEVSSETMSARSWPCWDFVFFLSLHLLSLNSAYYLWMVLVVIFRKIKVQNIFLDFWGKSKKSCWLFSIFDHVDILPFSQGKQLGFLFLFRKTFNGDFNGKIIAKIKKGWNK